MKDFKESQLYRDWARRVKGEIANDFVIVITPHSSTSGSGSGKTTLAVQLCKKFDLSDSGFDASTNATMDAGELVDSVLDESEHGSALLWDEAQGAPGTDGLDARRAMKSEPMDAVKAVLASRDQRHTLVIIGQQIGMMDPRLYPLLDAWVNILHDPEQPQGPLATYYEFIVDDYDLKDPDIKTRAIEDLSWGPIPQDDPDYNEMERMKQEAKTAGGEEREDPDTAKRKEKIKTILRATKPWHQSDGMTQRDAAKLVDMSQGWVAKRIREWKDGDYSNLVERSPGESTDSGGAPADD